jgi:hypothetical protein
LKPIKTAQIEKTMLDKNDRNEKWPTANRDEALNRLSLLHCSNSLYFLQRFDQAWGRCPICFIFSLYGDLLQSGWKICCCPLTCLHDCNSTTEALDDLSSVNVFPKD